MKKLQIPTIAVNDILYNDLQNIMTLLTSKLDKDSSCDALICFSLIGRVDSFLAPFTKEVYALYKENSAADDKTELETKINDITRGIKFYNVSGFCISDLLKNPGSIESHFRIYIKGFDAKTQNILYRLNILDSVGKLCRYGLLYEILNRFYAIDFGQSITNIQIAETLSRVVLNSSKFSGEFSTPLNYIYIVQALLFGKEVKGPNINIYDPVCGTGNLLRNIAFNAYHIYNEGNVRIYGEELSPNVAGLSMVSSFLIGDDPNHIQQSDSLVDNSFREKKFQYIIGDLPTGTVNVGLFNELGGKNKYAPDINSRFFAGFPEGKDSQVLFIQHMISKMDKSARIAVITNLTPLISGDSNSAENYLRKWLVEHDMLEMIVSLPDNSRTNTHSTSYCWIISNNKDSKRKGFVRFVDSNLLLELESEHIDDYESLAYVLFQLYDSDSSYPYIVDVLNKDLEYYTIELENVEQKRRNIDINVPLSQDVNKYLLGKGYDCNGEWKILYDKTTLGCDFPFKRLFTYEDTSETFEYSNSKINGVVDTLSSLLNNIKSCTTSIDPHLLIETNDSWYNEVPKSWKLYSANALVKFRYSNLESAKDKEDVTQQMLDGKTVLSCFHDGTVKVAMFTDECKSPYVLESRDTTILSNRFLRCVIIAMENHISFIANSTSLSEYHTRIDLRRILSDAVFYLPSLDKQEEIASFIEYYAFSIDYLSHEHDVKISSLFDYKKSLYYELITGKLLITNLSFMHDVNSKYKSTRDVIFVIDSSGSMFGSKIDTVNEVMSEIVEMFMSSQHSYIRNLSIVSFSNDVQTTTFSSDQEEGAWTNLIASGVTSLGAACQVIDKLLSNGPFSNSKLSNDPIIVLLLDGAPTDNFEGSYRKLYKNPNFKRAIKMSVAIGRDADMNILSDFTGSSHMVYTALNSVQLKTYLRTLWYACINTSEPHAPSKLEKGNTLMS